MNQTRRHFFKTVAATLAAGTAAVVAPSVVGKEKPLRVLMYKGVPFCYQPDLGKTSSWESYYANHLDIVDDELLAKLDAACKSHKFNRKRQRFEL